MTHKGQLKANGEDSSDFINLIPFSFSTRLIENKECLGYFSISVCSWNSGQKSILYLNHVASSCEGRLVVEIT